MTTTFCTSGSVKLKAGVNVNSTITFDQYEELINEAEQALNVVAKAKGFDLIEKYSTMSSNFKLILQDGASSHAAVGAINYDVDAIGRGTSNLMQNVLWTRFKEAKDRIENIDTLDRIRSF